MTNEEHIKNMEIVERVIDSNPSLFEDYNSIANSICIAIEALIFQESVVRCKDCIHQYKDEKLNGLYCALMTTVNIKIIADNDEYCSAGERRDEE